MFMNTMEAVGAGLNLSSKGETPGLNLGADAEALALFASLFAMMRTPQQDGATVVPVPQEQLQSEETKSLLPAAAMLMAELAPTAHADEREVPFADMLTNDLETGEDKRGDTAGLLKLLLEARDIAAPDLQAVIPGTAKEENMITAAPARTATEMLTGAIEILKALEVRPTPSGSFQNAPGHMETPPASATMLQADLDFNGPMSADPDINGPMSADPDIIGPMSADRDFIGPMLADPDIIGPMSADPDFIGPMPVDPDFIGPMPVDPDFIGPMPVVQTPTTLAKQAVLLPANPDFIGPMPVVTPTGLRAAVGVRVLAAPSSDFIGPMPAIPSATVEQTVEASSSAPNGNGPLPAVTHTGAKALAESRLDVSATEPAELAPQMATSRTASAAEKLTGILPEPARAGIGATVVPSVLISGTTPAQIHGLNPGLNVDQEQPLKSSASHVSASEEGADKDEGFVSRRADMLTAGKDLVEKTAIQQKFSEIQNKGARMMSNATELSKGSAASTSSSVQAFAQQGYVTSQVGKMISSTSSLDVAQNAAASTASGQSGGQSGSQPGSQQFAQQMADGGMARGASDRTLLHRLNTDNAGWSEVMVKRLTADLRSGVQNVRIILEPRQLGRLNVELGVRNGQALIRIAADTQEAAKLLSGARGQLGQMLEMAGLRLAGFQATSSQASDSNLDTSQGSQGRGGEGGSDNAGRNNAGRDQDFSNKMVTAVDEHAEDSADGPAALREGETAVLSILA
ncbi:flagellar hook-length control protein FliK [SAR116 cluster bacterium]|nr:flagellar hook-length control protein FliK [SAR116 cluster bacterium]